MKPLRILAFLVAAAFALLLIVGFDNVLAVFRSRVALFFAIAPIFLLFVWCIYKAFLSHKQLPDQTHRNNK